MRSLVFVALFAVGCGSGSIDDGATADPTDGASADEGTLDTASDSTSANDAIANDTATTSDTGTPDTATPKDSATSTPTCLGAAAGAYCGSDEMKDADPDTLYQCPGAGKPPTSSTKCASGCVIEAAGTPDHCKVVSSPTGYRLPWPPGTSMQLTQDCNDSCCSDHVGNDQWAWDWANGSGFTIVAARGGTITHLKSNSTSASSCANDANILVIDHGDGTQALYMHFAGGSLRAGVTCGATVTRGQPLATAGTTGWSTGVHLHFQVEKVHTGAPTCECGTSGTGCATNTVPWSSMWVTATYPSVSINFEEWPTASSCGNRRLAMPASINAP